MVISPLSFCEFFEIHGSKFKPYPIRDLGEAAVGGITHSVFFFRIRKDPFNGFFALLVKVGILGSVSCVIGKLLVIFPNMPLYDLYAIFGMCAKMSCRAVLTCFGIALVFSVSVSVGRTVCKRMVLGTNHAWCIPKKVDKRAEIWYNNRHTSKEGKRCQQSNTMKTSKSHW